ncbi:hypothetical protein S40285_09646, partial [Stachybotrys chlorohalonatus IBT 40285]
MSNQDLARLEREIENLRQEKEAAQAREEAERREKEKLARENRPTTLDEYLRSCHIHLQQNFKLADELLFTTGYTQVDGKVYPKRLRPWTE